MLKEELIQALQSNDIASAAAIGKHGRKVLTILVRLAYDKETLVGWRAVIAVGIAARELVKTDPGILRETCRKLLWSLTDESGGIGWSAPELIGEIVSADPRLFCDIVPLVAAVYDVEEETFRAGVLYALGRIAERAPDLALPYQKIVVMSLVDKDPLVRIRGMQLVGGLWSAASDTGIWSGEYRGRVKSVIARLAEDKGEAWIYRDSDFVNVQVGEMATQLIKLLI